MKIAVIAMGSVGTTLGDMLMKTGSEIKYGVRDPTNEKTKAAMAERPEGATVDTIQNAVSWSEVILLATPSFHEDGPIIDVGKSLGNGVAGKVVVDATNPCTSYPGLETRWAQGTSAAEVLQEAIPTAKVAKIFNTIGSGQMDAPDGSKINGKQLTMLYACDLSIKDTAQAITAAAGWDPVYVGPLRYSRNLEAIAELWIHMGVKNINGESPGANFHFQYVSDKKP